MQKKPPALSALSDEISSCRACARLVAWRESAPHQARSVGDPGAYWARAVPGFGDPHARVLIVGLAPAAHGANRTGRMFTGDRSGDFLFAALHRAGLASQPESAHRGDGLVLHDVYVTSAVHCAPPDNKPTRDERIACSRFLRREIGALENVRVVLALGAFALEALLHEGGLTLSDGQRAKFAHGAEFDVRTGSRALTLVSSYHPSQRNVFTGLLSAQMFDGVLARIATLLAS